MIIWWNEPCLFVTLDKWVKRDFLTETWGYLISILAISYQLAALRGIELRPRLVNKKERPRMQSGQGRNTNVDSIYCRVFWFHLESFFVNISDVLHNSLYRENCRMDGLFDVPRLWVWRNHDHVAKMPTRNYCAFLFMCFAVTTCKPTKL